MEPSIIEQKAPSLYESPNPEVDFEAVNETRKKVEFSYDRQVPPFGSYR